MERRINPVAGHQGGIDTTKAYLDHEMLPSRVLEWVGPSKADQVLTDMAATVNPDFPE